MIDAIADSLKSGQDVKIAGFGNFQVAERAASTGAIHAPVSLWKSRRPSCPNSRLARR
jgi:hypothetical protein